MKNNQTTTILEYEFFLMKIYGKRFFQQRTKRKIKQKEDLKGIFMHSGDGKIFLIFSAPPKTVLFIK